MSILSRTANISEDVTIHYRLIEPATSRKGTIVLIHGFPQTGYQFRHVQGKFAAQGYRIVVPDYRGAGRCNRPHFGYEGFTKFKMAADIYTLLYADLKTPESEPVHIVGHDIGGMIAAVYALLYPNTASVIWGECPTPGTSVYEEVKDSKKAFHFNFHSVPDLPEALTAGRERIYLSHFYHKLAYNQHAITEIDIDHYAAEYSQPGAMRCGFNVYRAFDLDAKEVKEHLQKHGKSKVRCLVLNGDRGFASRDQAVTMGSELFTHFEAKEVSDAGHWIAEENPTGFVSEVLAFIEKSQ